MKINFLYIIIPTYASLLDLLLNKGMTYLANLGIHVGLNRLSTLSDLKK